MATTPFTTTTVANPGQALPRDRNWLPTTRNGQFWLGKAGNMVQLPSPDPGYQVGTTRAETLHTLIGGGTTVTRRLASKRTWPLTWKRIQRRDLQIVLGFYRGAWGDGPFLLIDPADVNLLGFDTSLCGARNGLIGSWAADASCTVVYDSTITSPIPPCGVLRWHGAGNGSILATGPRQAGTGNTLFDATFSPPVVQALARELSLYAWTASSTASARLVVQDGGGSGSGTTGSTVTLNTTPQLLAMNVAAGAFGTTGYIVPGLQCLTASAPDIFVSAAQFEYGVATPSAFGAGSAVPRVIIPAITRSVDRVWGSPIQLTLVQI